MSSEENHYPVEVDFPDIDRFATGSHGTSYVYSFDSGVPGPHVMINSLTHGNEVCGAIVVKELLDMKIRPRQGRLTLAFANVDAYRRFDPQNPDTSRFVDQDFNRVWNEAVLEDRGRDSVELRRARAMRPVIDTVDLLLDIHSMHERSEPLLLSGPLDKGIKFAREVGVPMNIVVDEGHSEGRRLRDYDGFGNPGSKKNALLVECGQHWEISVVEVARRCAGSFLTVTGALSPEDLPPEWLPVAEPSQVIRVTHAIVALGSDFRFAAEYKGLEVIAKAGTTIGWDGDRPITTPYDNCVLVMPSLRQLRPGVTVVRFGILDQ